MQTSKYWLSPPYHDDKEATRKVKKAQRVLSNPKKYSKKQVSNARKIFALSLLAGYG